MILPFIIALQLACVDSVILNSYANTEYGSKTIRLMEYQAISYDYLSILQGAAMAESSMGWKLIGDDGKSLGLFQNKIDVVLLREHPLGYTASDSLTWRIRLLGDDLENMRQYQQTLYEMLRHHINCGRAGDQAMRAAIRSTNRGKKRVRYMDRAGTEYLKKVLK